MNTENDQFKEFTGFVRELNDLQRRAAQNYKPIVDDILLTRSRDVRRIEHTLDRLLDFCDHEPVLQMYKDLCRHYLTIDPEATAYYVNTYREHWDSGAPEDDS